MSDSQSFLDIFDCCTGLENLCGGLSLAKIQNVVVHAESFSMEISAHFQKEPTEQELSTIKAKIASTFGLAEVIIKYQFNESLQKDKKDSKEEKSKDNSKVLLGRMPKQALTQISELNLESNDVCVCGDVFDVEEKEIPKRNAMVFNFCLTDYTGSIRVSKFLTQEQDKSFVKEIHKGDHLRVHGNVSYDRYDKDIKLEPRDIVKEAKELREDIAEGEKRVELHMHTRFSTQDALTDPADIIKTAARWGHKAVAVTDHGVAQAFPDIWKASGNSGVKVIYGCEGYYVNDVNESPVVIGDTDLPLDSEFVGFDLETTGFSANTERIIEIGAVRIRNGEIVEKFQSFVNPKRPISSEISRLTGIQNSDVADAPLEKEAVEAFLRFAGESVLVAHNAAFDIGFITAASKRCGLEFHPVYIDTVPLSRFYLRTLRHHKLDDVSGALGLPEFNHHRADDDAATCGLIYAKLAQKAQEEGLQKIKELNTACVIPFEEQKNVRSYHITLLVQNKDGLKNLYKLISKSHLEYFHRHPIIPKSVLQEHREGILIGSACEAGEIFSAIVRHRSDAELDRLGAFYDYFEIQPICNNRFLIADGKANNDDDLRNLNRQVLALGRRLGKPVCATGDVHFLNPEDEIYRHILLAAKKMSDADKELPLYFKTTDEMLSEFSYLGEEDCYDVVVRQPNAIADTVETFELLPKDLYPPEIPHAAEDLHAMVWKRTHELYGENPPEIITKRIEQELSALGLKHYEVIYMSAQKLVQNSLEHGYLVGSRGSVGSSLVAYMSGITEVNALPPHYRCPSCKHVDFENVYDENGEKYGCGPDMPDRVCPVCGAKLAKEGFDIPFETFLGFPENPKVPDIDLNFSGEYQANAHKYTEELFGRDHVFRAGTIGTLADKTAYGYVKKYLEERGRVVTKAEENRLTSGCVGVKRTTGQHPGGLVVVPQNMDVTDFCPVQHPADDAEGGIITTHFEYHCMEANLLKLDELGHDDPTMIRMMEDMTGINAREIPLDDPETMSIFTSPKALNILVEDPIVGQTGSLGVPEFGTGFTRQMLVDTKPERFSTLVRLSGFSHGTDVWNGNIHDLIVDNVAPVDQCVSCRDDIMLYLIDKGVEPKRAFQFMEDVRKGKFNKGKHKLADIEDEMKKLDVPTWWVESCRKIQYLFPKAHAVAYVTMAFRIAYFKVHYPLAYYSAYFYRRSEKGGFDAESMILGKDVCLQKINAIKATEKPTAKEEDLMTTLEVVYEFYMRGFEFLNIELFKSDAAKFIIEDGKLRPPFVAISGLGTTAAEDLARCKDHEAEILSVDELSHMCPKVNDTHLEQLKALGALKSLPDSTQFSLFDF